MSDNLCKTVVSRRSDDVWCALFRRYLSHRSPALMITVGAAVQDKHMTTGALRADWRLMGPGVLCTCGSGLCVSCRHDSSICSILQFLGNFLHSILDEDGPSSPSRYTDVFLIPWPAWENTFELDLFQWISSNSCSLWDSSSRCDLINAYSEFLRSKFWRSMLYSVRYSLLWSEFSATIACWALRWRCSRRSHPSE